MLHKSMIALFAMASIAVLASAPASARGFGGGFHGGGFHGGGFGGWHGGGGGWHGGYGRGFPLAAAGIGLGIGYGAYGYGYGYPAGYDDGYYYGDGGYGGCYVVRQRVHTRYGLRIRPVEVCD